MILNDPELVRAEYASEAPFLARLGAYESGQGPDCRRLTIDAVAEVRPGRLLEVGCGPGAMAEQIEKEMGCAVVAVDISPRMVEIARDRGVQAQLGDIQQLDLPDGHFDCALAAWMLYHVPDLDRGLAELARVLRPGGRLVAATNDDDHLRELRELVGAPTSRRSTFTGENGATNLARHFVRVERRRCEGTMTFPDTAAARAYVAASITMRDFASAVPELDRPLVARRSSSIFVAEKSGTAFG